jgi:sulfotransferase family protein
VSERRRAELAGSVFADRVIFVLGTVRSGTTWFEQLLGAHPDIAMVDLEAGIFHALWDLWLNAHSAEGSGVGAYLPPGQIAAAVRRFCDQMFSAARDRVKPDATWFAEKTPGHYYRLPLMAATHPDAWYIHIIRDGRDVTRSQLRSPVGRILPGDAAAHWSAGVRRVHENRWQLARFQEIRYETLLANPVGELTRLFEWMGLEVDADVEARVEEKAGREVVRFKNTDPVGKGKWRDMNPDDLAKIYEEAGDLLVQLGYADADEILNSRDA